MTLIIGLALGLILAGLAMAWMAPSMGNAVLVKIVRVVGIVLVIVGLILLLTPVLIYINHQLRAMLDM